MRKNAASPENLKKYASQKAWAQKNKEKIAAYSRAYRVLHPEKVREINARSAKGNRPRRNADFLEWQSRVRTKRALS